MKPTNLSCVLFVSIICFFYMGGVCVTFGIVGDTCTDPFVISSLPFSGIGSTCGFFADTGGYCCTDYGAPDVVYVFMPEQPMSVDISLCGSSYDTVLYVFEGDCSNMPIACNDDSCNLQSQINSLQFQAGIPYYIVVDGYANACGDYTLSITEAAPNCDDGDACTEDYYDPQLGCVHTPISCDDGDPSTNDSCDPQFGCIHLSVCDDGDACTEDIYDPDTQTCSHIPIIATTAIPLR